MLLKAGKADNLHTAMGTGTGLHLLSMSSCNCVPVQAGAAVSHLVVMMVVMMMDVMMVVMTMMVSHHALLARELPSARAALVAESRTWVDKELVHLQRRLLEREVRTLWATVLGMVCQLEGYSVMNL